MSRRVLLVNKFYYPRGGDCIVVLNTEALLRDNGVEAEVFAMKYPQNLMARYQDMFASEVTFGGGLGNQVRALKRTLGYGDVRAGFEAVLDEYKPDVVHLHNIHSYLSPVLGELAHKRGIRVVWTLHDYKLLCPRYDCLLDGKPCERCFNGGKHNVLSHRCMKGSLPASAVAWVEALKWNRRRLEDFTDVFVCPSEFMAAKMRAGGLRDYLMIRSRICFSCFFLTWKSTSSLNSSSGLLRSTYPRSWSMISLNRNRPNVDVVTPEITLPSGSFFVSRT